MIFDSQQATRLANRYATEPVWCSPLAIHLIRSEYLSAERDFLEDQIALASISKRQDWIGRLLSKRDSTHVAAWFEMALFGWLKTYGVVDVEPSLNDEHPDFVVTINDQKIAIEARAFTQRDDERIRTCLEGEVWSAVDNLPRPYIIHIRYENLVTRVDKQRLTSAILSWLDSEPSQVYVYQDQKGNRVRFEATLHASLKETALISGGSAGWISPTPLHEPLHQKARQHPATRNSGMPYIIAMFLESPFYSADEVQEAWFGRTSYVIDFDTSQVVDVRLDGTGLHFLGNVVQHRTVSGTLVFKRQLNEVDGRFTLAASYIDNPYAIVKFDPRIFVTDSRFVIVNTTDDGFEMRWVNAYSSNN